MTSNNQSLATYLLALAIIEQTGRTYVSRELRTAIDTMAYELKLEG